MASLGATKAPFVLRWLLKESLASSSQLTPTPSVIDVADSTLCRFSEPQGSQVIGHPSR
jgi:hypothetical protein